MLIRSATAVLKASTVSQKARVLADQYWQQPRAEYVPIEGAGHYAFMTRSEFVLRELVAWEHQLASL